MAHYTENDMILHVFTIGIGSYLNGVLKQFNTSLT